MKNPFRNPTRKVKIIPTSSAEIGAITSGNAGMISYEPVKKKDRRKRPDIWLRSISFFGVIGWLVMLVAIIIVDKARPELETVTTRFHNIMVRTIWDRELTAYLFYLMVVGLFISFTGLIINSRRLKRKDDRLRINLILLLLISIAGIVIYFV